jgi:hypothetical protein
MVSRPLVYVFLDQLNESKRLGVLHTRALLWLCGLFCVVFTMVRGSHVTIKHGESSIEYGFNWKVLQIMIGFSLLRIWSRLDAICPISRTPWRNTWTGFAACSVSKRTAGRCTPLQRYYSFWSCEQSDLLHVSCKRQVNEKKAKRFLTQKVIDDPHFQPPTELRIVNLGCV